MSEVEFTEEEQAILNGQEPGEPAEENNEQAPEPEQGQEPDDVHGEKEKSGQEEEKKQKLVPLPALHEEREKRRRLAEKLKEAEIQRARLEERWNIILQQQQQAAQKAQETKIPDPEEDPITAVKMMQQQVEQMTAAQQQQMALQQQQQQIQQALALAESEAAKYREKVNSELGEGVYDEAFRHVWNGRLAEIKSFGYNDQQAEAALQAEAQQIMLQAVQSGRNPGEILMEIAKARGFSPERAKANAEEPQSKAETIERGQRLNRGLGNQSSGKPTGKITPEDIAKMSDEEFAKFMGEDPDAAMKKAFGV